MKTCVCPYCNKEVSYHLRDDVIEEYKGKNVGVKISIAVCDECGKDIFVPSIEDENLKKLYDKYREMTGIVSPSEISLFRDKYNISQRELVSILNWGKMTINRYERGSLPSQSHSDCLKTIISNEEVFKQKVNEAYKDSRISKKLYARLEKSFENSKKNIAKLLISLYLKHEESIYNGYRKFDIERVENLIGYIADMVDNLYKTSLNKYLWFIDFENFKENVRSITGIRYVKLQYGPVIEERGYENIINLLDDKFYKEEIEEWYNDSIKTKIISKKNYDMSIFSREECEVIDRVIDKLKTMSCGEISELSHKESAWKDNNINDFISYDYAEQLKLNI